MFLQRCFYLVFISFSFFSLFPALANGAQANFSWLPNTEANLAGYKIHYGTSSGNYTTVIDAGLPDPVDSRVHATVDNLTEGNTYYFAAMAYDSNGNESDFSQEVSYTVFSGDSVTKIFGNTPDADYPDTIAETSTNINDTVLEGSQTVSTWSWSSPSPHKVANTIIVKTNLNTIPSSATIVEARLYLYQTAASGETQYLNTAHKITGHNPVIGELSGQNAAIGIPWNAVPAGTTYNNIPLGLGDIGPAADEIMINESTGYHSWLITDMVQEWIADPAGNFGILINGQDGMTSETGRTFAATENSDASIRPKLVVRYQLTASATPPVANNLSVNGIEDTPVTGQLSVDNSGGLPLQYTVTSAPSQGTLTVEDATGTFTYTPAPDYNGTDSFSFTAANANGESNPANVEIGINPANDTPVAANSTFTTDEDITMNGQLEADDPDGDNLVYILVAAPTQGTATINSNGTFTYIPAENGTDTDSFSFKVNDGSVNSAVANVTITINPVNDEPVAHPAAFATQEDTVVSGQLAADDPDGETLSYTMSTSPALGMASMNSSGSFTYTPAANTSGTDSFSYKANDGFVNSAAATVTITINPVNDAPLAYPAAFTTQENTAVSGQLAADDPDGDTVNYIMVANPAQGTASMNSSGSFTYTPAANASGSDSFSFKVNDGSVDSAVATVTITTNPVNDAPTAYPAAFTTMEDTVTSGQLAADDPDGDTLTYAMVASPGQGTASLNSSGSFTYAPAVNASGTDSFSYKVNDGFVNSATATVTITVTPVNDAPVAEDSTLTVDADTAVSGRLSAADPEEEPLTFSIVSSPSQGTVIVNSDGAFTYTASKDGSGDDSFSFQANDGTSTSDTASVAITITPAVPSLVLEAGEVDVDHNWIHVDFVESFTAPVVIARLTSKNDGEPCLVRIDSITATGFNLRLQEYDYLDGIHPLEQVSFMVLEAGHYTLSDGTQLEAGSRTVTKAYDPVSFSGQFTTTPVVVTSIATVNDKNAVTARVRKIKQAGFEYKLQEQEANRQNHAPETVNYLAWEPSVGLDNGIRYEVATTGNSITGKTTTVEFTSSFSRSPLIVTDMQTTDGREPSSLRTLQVSPLDLQLAVEEEQSKDSEIKHTTEDTGFIAILAE